MTERMKPQAERYKSAMNSLVEVIYANANLMLSERGGDTDYEEYIKRTDSAYENLVNAVTQMSSMSSLGNQIEKYD